MRRELTFLLCGVGFLALLGYRYDFNATAFLERRWRFALDDVQQTGATFPELVGLEASPKLPDSQKERKARVRRVCQRYADRLLAPQRPRRGGSFFPGSSEAPFCSTADCPLLVDLEHKFLFCFVHKVAATSVKALYGSSSAAATARDNGTALPRVGTAFYTSEQLGEFYKAMFVRHPFQRLVSVYEDRVARESAAIFSSDRQFTHFLARRNITAPMSFADFVDYLIETPRFEYDERWMPYFERCQPCHVHYDFLGKLETADEDFDAMLRVNGLGELGPRLAHLNARNGTDFADQFFMQLERNQIMALYRIYRFDFELFGYSILNYIDTFENGI